MADPFNTSAYKCIDFIRENYFCKKFFMEYSKVIIKEGKEKMDIGLIHKFLSEQSYWAKGISYHFVDKSLTHSFNVGAFISDQQIGFGRVITDYYTFGWLADFFVTEEHRG